MIWCLKMADYIERQSVYDVLRKAPISNMGTKLSIYDDIEEIPAVDVLARKTGEWVDVWHNSFRAEVQMCSNCKGISAFKTNFCSNCGADMRQEEKPNEN